LDGNPRISGIGIDMGAYELDVVYVTFSVTGANGTLGATVDGIPLTSVAAVERGRDVVFTATPAAGYRVKSWTVDGATVSGHTTNTYTISGISTAHTVTVEFEPDNYTVTLTGAGTGASGGGSYAPGATVTINAGTPPAGYRFKEWTTTSAGVTFADAGSTTTTFTMPANDANITAVFERIAYTVGFNITGDGTVTTDKTSAYPGETIILTIMPEGYSLLSRIIAFYTGTPEQTVTVYGTNINTRYFIMPDHDVTVSAVFAEIADPIIQRSITIVPSENGKIVSDKLFAPSYEKVTLTIQPDAGFELSTITVYNDYAETVTVPLTGEGDTRTFVMPPYPVTVIVMFNANTYSSTGNCIDCHSDQSGRILRAWTLNGKLHVSGLTPGQPWQVYNLYGQLVYTGIAVVPTAELSLPARGIYIIKSGNQTVKVEFRN
jgi:hypothetical protein